MSDLDPMEGVTDQTITIPVTDGQYAELEKDRVMPGRPRITYKVAVGPFVAPGNWVVVGTIKHHENGCTVTLAQLAQS